MARTSVGKFAANLILAAACVVFSSCATRFSARLPGPDDRTDGLPAPPGMAPRTPRSEYRPAVTRSAELTRDEKSVTASAEALLGQAPNARVTVNGKTFMLDCIGTVSAIYYRLSIDITKDFASLPGNGVRRLYESLRRRNAVHTDTYPRPGDVIFWDNTWDANSDGNRNNDPLTHAGIVLSVDEDGTVRYVHAHYRRGVVVEVMNLLDPVNNRTRDGKIINSPLALGSGISRRNNPERWLSGDLWNSFGDVLREKKYYTDAGRRPANTAITDAGASGEETGKKAGL